MRKILVDCGANLGHVLRGFIEAEPERDFYAFEPNAALLPTLRDEVTRTGHPRVEIHNSAVWTHDGTVDLFLGHHESSTVMPGKRVPPVYDQQIDYTRPVPIPAVDFSAWLRRTARTGDDVTVKMDVEGAEYPVLAKLLRDGTLDLITTLYVEWHHDRFPHMPRAEHDALCAKVCARTDVREWD